MSTFPPKAVGHCKLSLLIVSPNHTYVPKMEGFCVFLGSFLVVMMSCVVRPQVDGASVETGRRRSDDTNPIQPVVEQLSQQMVNVQAQLTALQNRLGEMNNVCRSFQNRLMPRMQCRSSLSLSSLCSFKEEEEEEE